MATQQKTKPNIYTHQQIFVTQQKPNQIPPLITVEAVDDTLILRQKTEPNDEEYEKFGEEKKKTKNVSY